MVCSWLPTRRRVGLRLARKAARHVAPGRGSLSRRPVPSKPYVKDAKTTTAMEIEDLGVEAIASSLSWFEASLLERNIKLDPKCALRGGIDGLSDLAAKAHAGLTEWLPAEVVLRFQIQATSTDTLIKVLHQGEDAKCVGLAEFGRHWRNLKAGNPLITGPSNGHSQERTKTWELVLASLCAVFCDEVHDEEPDIVCVRAQQRLGIAAKMLFTATKSAFCSRIEEGIGQIEGSAVDGGIVAINLADVYPHEEEFKAFHRTRIRYPSTLLCSLDNWVGDFLETYGPTPEEWKKLFTRRKKLMGLGFFLPTVVTYRNGHFPQPMPLYRWGAFYATQREAEATEFLTEIQNAYQRSRSFRAQQPTE